MNSLFIVCIITVIAVSYVAYTYYKKSMTCDENAVKQDADYKLKIAKIEGIVKDANSTIDKKEADLKKLGLSLSTATDLLTKHDEDCKTQITKIEGIVKDANSTIDKKEADLKKLGLNLATATDMIAKKDEELKKIQAILGDANTTLAKKEATLKKIGLNVTVAKGIIAEKNKQISAANDTISKKDVEYKDTISKLYAQIKQRDDTISKLYAQISIAKGAWVQYDFNDPRRLSFYTVANSTRPTKSMTDWTIVGSNDGVKWSLIDQRRGVKINANDQRFDSQRQGSYRYMRWIVERSDDVEFIFAYTTTWMEDQGNNMAKSLGTNNITYSTGEGDRIPERSTPSIEVNGKPSYSNTLNYNSNTYSGPTETLYI